MLCIGARELGEAGPIGRIIALYETVSENLADERLLILLVQ